MSKSYERKHCVYCGGRLSEVDTDARTRLICRDCERINYRNPLPSVAIIVTRNDEVLLIKRGVEPKIGHWAFPGGFVDWKERPEDAAIRELSEETGLAGINPVLFDVQYQPSDSYGAVINICYNIYEVSGEPIAGDDATEIRFFSIGKLPPLAFRSHQAFAEKLIASKMCTI